MRVDFAEIKKTTDIAAVVRAHGVELKPAGRHLKGRCPFHDDKTPSFIVTPEKGLFHCPGCGAAGNVIQFVARIENLTDREAALKLLNAVPGITRASALAPAAVEPPQPGVIDQNAELFAAIIEHYHETLLTVRGSNKSGLEYLQRRGLGDIETLQHFKIGLADGSLKTILSVAQLENAKALGLINERGNEKYYGRAVVPIFDTAGRPCGLYGRDITGKSEVAHLYLAGGHRAVWNADAARVYPEELIVTEAIFDALAIWIHAGKKNVITAYGASGWTAHHADLIEEHRVKKLVFAFDADERGQEAARAIAATLTESLGIDCRRLKWPAGVKDANAYFLYNRETDHKGDAKSFAALLAAAPRIGFPREAPARLRLSEKTGETALFENGTIAYRVRHCGGQGLRIVLSATREGKTHTDRLDLYAARSRKLFGAAVAARLDEPASKVDADLTELITHLETLAEEGAAQPETNEPPPMSDAARREAERLLKSRKLMQRIASDLDVIGYVGESANKRLAYLIGTSRKLPKPLSGIVRSQSGAGKSYLMECMAELMPPEDVHFYSRLTPQALYYLEPDALKHRLLIVDERNGSEDAEYPIRTLQTRKKLRLAVPIKDPNTGRIRTVTLEIEGPIAYMESTTAQSINPENENRCFELYLDESDEQTRAIFAAQRKARTLDGWKVERLREKVRRVHHDAQRLLRPLKVIIPFIECIEFPESWLRGRRDHDRFLSLIEGIAFLHQLQRQIAQDDGEEYVIASLDDYALAYELAAHVFGNTLGDLPKPVADLVAEIETMLEKSGRQDFTRRDVREHTRLPDYLLKRHIRAIEELEYVEVQRTGRGGSFRYRLVPGRKAPPVLEGLSTPGALAQKWNKWDKSGTGPETAFSSSTSTAYEK
jgi:DNA primase catalytic core